MKRSDRVSLLNGKFLGTALLLLFAMAATLQAKPAIAERAPNGWRVINESEMNKDQKKQKQTAKSARAELASRLIGKLLAAKGEKGAAGAIDVCKIEAPKIATDVGRKNKLKIGRTSFKLRNPANSPPAWAEQAVERKVSKPIYFENADTKFGVLLPIRIQPLCLDCHGPKAQIAESVRTALAKAYPNDQATGFKSGDLRGWFWIEVGNPINSSKQESQSKESDADASVADRNSLHHNGPGHRRGQGPMRAHEAIAFLLKHHNEIQRDVKTNPKGVVTVTTSKNPAVTKQIRKHVRQMKQRLESGHGMRHFDPLFRELFKHYEKIKMKIEDIDGGVRVTETSTDHNVVLLIHKHAEAVTAFVKSGVSRAAKPTPLPDGYEDSKK